MLELLERVDLVLQARFKLLCLFSGRLHAKLLLVDHFTREFLLALLAVHNSAIISAANPVAEQVAANLLRQSIPPRPTLCRFPAPP